MEITTAGDVDRARGDKSRWTGALEAALLAGDIDLAVHSAKDVPGELAEGTAIVAAPRRADPLDVLIGERHARRACARAPASARARCAAAPSCSPCGPTCRSPSCAATSTPGCASAPPARPTCSCSPPPGSSGSAAATRPAAGSTASCSCPPRARARSPSRPGPGRPPPMPPPSCPMRPRWRACRRNGPRSGPSARVVTPPWASSAQLDAESLQIARLRRPARRLGVGARRAPTPPPADPEAAGRALARADAAAAGARDVLREAEAMAA